MFSFKLFDFFNNLVNGTLSGVVAVKGVDGAEIAGDFPLCSSAITKHV
ncbi:hypothetical protein ES708_12643 [subsurface metagenome]|jgi:hypothetical protein